MLEPLSDVGARCRALLLALALASPAIADGRRAATGFEEVPAGAFTELVTGAGIWRAEEGHASVDDAHRRDGRQCLHLRGGEASRVELEPALDGEPASELRFWAERWTAREPFELRVEGLSGGRWRALPLAGDEIAVGGFHARVRVPVNGPLERLRLTCNSPGGVLIDDVELGRLAPMELVGAKVEQPVVPCLVGRDENDVALVRVETSGALDPLELRELVVSLRGTSSLADIASVEVLAEDGARFGEALAPAEALVFRGALRLPEGETVLRLCVRLAPDADLDHRVDAGCESLRLSRGEPHVPTQPHPPGAQRIGLALRDAGDDGAAVYRIPGLVTTNAGTLLAVYDVRWRGWGDLPGDIDVGMSRSVDGGRSWEPMRIVLDMGDDPAHRYDGVGDPSALVDSETGAIWVAALWSHGERGWHGSEPGITPEETGQLLVVKSEDDGRTWSAPRNITAEVKRPEWSLLLQGPGRGICARDGTLVFPAQYRDAPARGRTPYATILYSRDRGASWQVGAGARPDTTEAQVVELEDGELMLNVRDDRGGARSVFTTRDLGATWQEHPSSRRALVEPVCNAGLIRLDGEVLLFSNPAVDAPPRRRMTLKASLDLGVTWPAGHQLLLDEGPSAGYSSLTRIDAETIGVLFESSRAQLAFLRVPLAELLP